jgi:sterol desaturase/sphingolipid hydroxylase (fatty acid hydroxylase superfamily)
MTLSTLVGSAVGVAALIVCEALTILAVWLCGERWWPAQAPRAAADHSNLHVWIAGHLTQFTLSPAMGAVVTALVNRAGGGLIVLPSHGWGLLAGAAVYLLAMDFGEFAFHRAQHRLPWLWAWHSLHHSDTTYDATTTVRHFWLDPFAKSVTVWLAVGLLFKASGPITLIYAGLSLYNFVIHSNTRLDLGRWSWLLNAPGYHRLHHSASREHFDINFAALLPIFDVLSGTYRPASPGERPATGLDTGETPREALDAIVWPIRGRFRRGERRSPPPVGETARSAPGGE